MNVLILGTDPSPLKLVLDMHKCRSIEFNGPIDVEYLHAHFVDFIISYRYRRIISKEVVESFKDKIINLHISFLPWNRGADPNLWSFLEDSPKGVTIHYINEGVDSGDIIAQKEIVFDYKGETLATTYERLNREIIELFKEQWALIMRGDVLRLRQTAGGSTHRKEDKRLFEHLLSEKGWDTSVEALVGKALTRSEKGKRGR